MHSQKFTKVLLQTTPGGHFYMAENRTLLLCVDSISAVWNWKGTSLPLAELNCVSPKRRKEMAARLGGESRAAGRD